MTASKSCSSLLKDVIAYVDVWSSNKTANFSEPFIQQLQEMGAQVSKTFNKQVTHVVFNNGHVATWEKAKKRNVKLVSVLWVARCHEDGVRADEDLYPALNDSDPVLKNKKHRCMQPRDSPERTPENDRRLRKKLDKMLRDLGPKPVLVTDVSPIVIDEESGIVYSPAFKRSDYMAQRLKDMKEKHENLSPTASQTVESCSPSGLKPSLGSTPTTFKYDRLDGGSCASVAEHGLSSDKEEDRTQPDATDDVKQLHWKDCEKPWLSPCRDVPQRISISPLDCPDLENEEEWDKQKAQRRISVRKKTKEKQSIIGLASSCQDGSDDSNSCHKEKTHSQIKDSSPAAKKSESSPDPLNKGKTKAAKSFTENNAYIYPSTLNSPSCLSSPGNLDEATVEPSKGNASLLQKISKNGRSSASTVVQSLTLPREPQSLTSHFTDGDDGTYEDYFSPANNHGRSLLPSLPVDRHIHIPFELDSVPQKRKQRRNESIASKTKKKSKLEESQSGNNPTQMCDSVNCEAQKHPHQDVQQPATPVDSHSASVSSKASNKRRQNTLSFIRTSAITTHQLKERRAVTAEHPLTVTEADATSGLWKNDVNVHSHAVECRGNEDAATVGLTEIPTEDAQNSCTPDNLDSKAKTMRTLVMTSMTTEKQHTLLQVVKALGRFSIVDQVCESTTHVVSGSHRRTLNILLGIARGCWILSFEWILWCLEKRQWIPEEPYELSDHFPAAQICRLQRHLSAGEHQQDLFQGHPPMFVSQHSQPPTQSLVELIQLCGGTVCKTVRQAGICIGKYSGRRPEGSRVLSEKWVLDSITYLKQLSYDAYYLE